MTETLHSSAGAQIIDLMLLVIDITKGIQTQTAECLIIGEITCDQMLVVLNKIDLVEESQRQSTIDKVRTSPMRSASYNSALLVLQMVKRLRKTFETTKFPQVQIVACSAASSLNLNELISTIQSHVFVPKRSPDGPFLFSVDHCFSIRGQGTVMTGTVLSGSVKINDVGDRCFSAFPHEFLSLVHRNRLAERSPKSEIDANVSQVNRSSDARRSHRHLCHPVRSGQARTRPSL